MAGKLEWFGGNTDALAMYEMFVDLAHTWDDLVDKDNPVSESEINNAFLITLFYLPSNPFYQKIQQHILPMWLTVVSAYESANFFEKSKDEHGIEIAHSLRYAAGHIISFSVHSCIGRERAKLVMPEVWKSIFFERYEHYKNEHLEQQ